MAIMPGKGMRVDSKGYEIREHGTASFPLACYDSDIHGSPVVWHCHREFELIYQYMGSGEVRTSGGTYIMEKGDAFFINSGVLHSVKSPFGRASRLHSIVFSPRLLGGGPESVFSVKYILPLVNSPLGEHLFKGGESLVPHLVDKAFRECRDERSGYELRVRNILTEILLAILPYTRPEKSEPTQKDLLKESRVKSMIIFIQENAAEDIGIEDIAKSASIGRTECQRCFKEILETTPTKYLAEYRLEKAAHLLASTSMKVIEVGFECGYRDTGYFNKVFKQRYSMPPSEFRSRARAHVAAAKETL